MNTRDPAPNLIFYGDFATREGGGGGGKSAKTSTVNAPGRRSYSVTMQVPWTICEQGLPHPQGASGNRSSQGQDGEGQATYLLIGYQLEFDRPAHELPAPARRRFSALLAAWLRVLWRGHQPSTRPHGRNVEEGRAA